MQEKIKNRIKAVDHMRRLHEIALRRCREEGTEAGVKHNELAMKQYQDEIDFLEELLEEIEG